ncbi:TetR/AcrR family transcriptional regulator [Velocimicrobium porci]|uniref:TetR/AcrR family transcriptional regulator n=1 Tax=Velocimicrobium porci TaxID=2606634 RepID=A0A6L5Y104_9FIRM|nr:TetR/AcrR family transcriptional regulator [Velocimicrobium porci]MSS64795.1 TetR/AcrR family transcriptional regulator [Velocimicrobium porci]
MKMSLSKRRILDEALKLFAINGYDATSIEQIANAVGIRKASFYSHFKSKQELLDTLIDEIEKRYEVYSELIEKDCEESIQWTANDVFKSVKQQFEFLLNDPFFSMARNFLTIEQFRNPQLASLQNKCEYIDALSYHKNLIQNLVENGILIDKDIDIMAYEFFSPIYVQFYHIQREPECKADAMKIVEKHINHFFIVYCK